MQALHCLHLCPLDSMSVKQCHLVQQMLQHIPEINGQLPWRFEHELVHSLLDDIIIFSQDAAIILKGLKQSLRS